MFFFGPSLRSVFRSRWMALLWAGLVIWFAVDFVGPAPTARPVHHKGAAASHRPRDATGSPVSAEDIQLLRRFAEGR
jgi:hypothetical protein